MSTLDSFSDSLSFGGKVDLAKGKMPVCADIEAAILSTFLLDQSIFEQYMGEVFIDDFYVLHHRDIFSAIKFVYESHKVLDLAFIYDFLSGKNKLDTFMKEYIARLLENIFSMGLMDEYIPLLREKSNLRKIIFSANRIISQCYEDTLGGSATIIDNAEKLFLEIISKQNKKHYNTLDFSVKNVFSSLANMTTRQGVTGVESGFSKLDRLTCGFQPGDLIVLAARPSMGKTAFSLCLAKNAALSGAPVAFVSLEMGSDQLAMRLLSIDARVPLSSLRSGLISAEEWMELTASAARVSDYFIFIDDTPAQTILDIKTRVRKVFLEKGIKLLIVDYLQLLQVNKKFETRHHEVSEISRSLKSIAKELGVPVIALSQLSRQVESRTDKRPVLSDLRDSGAIEQDADLILFLYRDEVYNKETPNPGQVEVIVGKHRNGPTGVVYLNFLREFTLFEDEA